MNGRVLLSLDRSYAVLRFLPAGYSQVDMPRLFGDYQIIQGLARSSTWTVIMPAPDLDLEVIHTRLTTAGYRVQADDQVQTLMHYNRLLRSGWKRP